MPGAHTYIYTDSSLTLYSTLTHGPGSNGLCKEKTLAGSQAAHMQSLAQKKMEVWGTWPAAQMQSSASAFYG